MVNHRVTPRDGCFCSSLKERGTVNELIGIEIKSLKNIKIFKYSANNNFK